MITAQHSSQEGRTIVEMLAYIMVMITITAGIAMLISKGYYRYECSSIQQDLVDFQKAIAKRYAADGHYTNVKWDDLCEYDLGPRDIMPEKICVEEGGKQKCKCKVQRGRHIFDGTVDIGKDDCDISHSYCVTFYIQFNDLPQDICAQLGTKSWSNISGSDLERMEINDTLWYWESSPIQHSGMSKKALLPASAESVSKACHEGYDNRVRWYFN